MQKIMDQYAGGIATDYRYNESRLALAKEKSHPCKSWWTDLRQKTWTICSRIYEVKERLVVCQVVIAHLLARKRNTLAQFCGKCGLS